MDALHLLALWLHLLNGGRRITSQMLRQVQYYESISVPLSQMPGQNLLSIARRPKTLLFPFPHARTIPPTPLSQHEQQYSYPTATRFP
jgi:hypothetical protein